MSTSITNNTSALGASRYLALNTKSMTESLARLSSGYKVNTGADSPAALVISEKLRAQLGGLQQAVRNTQDCGNVLSIAEGALSQMNVILNDVRSLAIHSANSGITSSDQIIADQAQVDSSIQAIDRIANSTKYSDQFLLNGSKQIQADSSTVISDPRNMELVNLDYTNFSQISRTKGSSVTISYADDNGRNEAQKAYFEISTASDASTQVTTDGTYCLSQKQEFTLSGELGSKSFSFGEGTHLGELVDSISNYATSTGVDAALIYDSSVESTSASGGINSAGSMRISGEAHDSGSLDYFTRDSDGQIVSSGGITSVTLGSSSAAAAGSSYGYSVSSVNGAGINTFTVGNSTDFNDLIIMQFEGVTSTDVPGGEIYLYNNGASLQAYSGGDHTTGSLIGTAALPGSDQIISLNLTGGGTMYLGYNTYTAGATSLGDAADATRPFASSLGWQEMDGQTINVELVVDDVNASALGLSGTTTGITASNLSSAFTITGGAGTGAAVLNAINFNVAAAFNEWQDVFATAGINVNFNFSLSSASDTTALGATIGNENTIRIAMAAFEDTTPSIDPYVAARGGYTGDNHTMYGSLAFDINDDWNIQDNVASYTLVANSDAADGGANFYSTLMHELGHVFGFAHPSDLYGANGLMSYNNGTANADVPYGLTPTSGAIEQSSDGSWKDLFMKDALTAFYGTGVSVSSTVLDQATYTSGDEIKITLTSGPSGSGFGSSGVSVAGGAFNSALAGEEINTAASGGVQVGDYNPGTVSGVLAGYNTDGYGRVYLRMTSDNDYAIYKDQDMTMQVAYGSFDASNATTSKESNHSGLGGIISMTRSPGDMLAGYTTMIQLDYMQEDVANTQTLENHGQGVDMSALVNDMVIGSTPVFTLSGSFLSGIRLGENTSFNGDIFLKGTFDNNGASCHLQMYSSSQMRDADLVAETAEGLDLTGATNAVRFFATQTANGSDTGLYGTLNIGSVSESVQLNTVIHSTNLAARISSTSYGDDAFIRLNSEFGSVWSYRDDTGDTLLVRSGDGGHVEYGQDARISVNGQQYSIDSMNTIVSSVDMTAALAFRAGDVGLTTIAATGYDLGTFATRAGQMHYNDSSKYSMVCHATGTTTQVIEDFRGGVQLQLGEGSGNKEQSVLGLQSMTIDNLGVIYDQTGRSKYCLKDLMSGGAACMGSELPRSLDIIDQAIDDVSMARARIGAWQANMLTTNAHSLGIAIENITSTESNIRDTDMATESTAFVKNQILVQAGTSILAQANNMQRSFLTLLG